MPPHYATYSRGGPVRASLQSATIEADFASEPGQPFPMAGWPQTVPLEPTEQPQLFVIRGQFRMPHSVRHPNLTVGDLAKSGARRTG